MLDPDFGIDLNGLNLYYLNGGTPKRFAVGDANLDGAVDDKDMSLVLANWGGQAAGQAAGPRATSTETTPSTTAT